MLPPDFVINSTLKVGVIYKMEAPELISTTISHHFVIIAIDEGDNYMLLSTTQMQNKINYINAKGYDINSLAHLAPSENNGLTENSFFNCNDTYHITHDQLVSKVENGQLTITGNLSEDEYNVLLSSIDKSTTFDIPRFMLVYPKE